MLDKLFESKWPRVLTFIWVVLSTCSPAMLFWAVYCREFFEKTDFVKMFFLSIAIASPLLAFNAFLFIFLDEDHEKNLAEEGFENHILQIIGFSSAMLMIPLYLAIGIKVFVPTCGVRTGILTVLVSQVLLWPLSMGIDKFTGKK